MNYSARFVTGLALASMLFASPVSAQDSGSMQVGDTTVSVGVGTAILTLPDIEYVKAVNFNAAPGGDLSRVQECR